MGRMISARTSALLLFVCVFHLESALADGQSLDRPFDSISIYAGQGGDHNLRELPGHILKGDIDWDKAYFTSIGLGKTLGKLGESMKSLKGTPLSGIANGYELVLVQHRGLQSNEEAGAAYTLRTPDVRLGPLGVNFGVGMGLSYAFGTPSYEDGPKDDPDRRYRLQLLALFELEWRIRSEENFSFVTRVHHRSGTYGVIAPSHVGSNFMAAGVRHQF